MTNSYDNVYLNEVSTISGPYESKGPFSKLYDKSYDDLYFNEKTLNRLSKLIDEC